MTALGFDGVGKLMFPIDTIFKNAAVNLADDIFAGDNIANFQYLPLFDMISPQHKISLISDICIGLLTPNSPLPPDTPEHHSAFYAIYEFARTQLEIEIDEERPWIPITNSRSSEYKELSESERLNECATGSDIYSIRFT
jgi:hypothetical protein